MQDQCQKTKYVRKSYNFKVIISKRSISKMILKNNVALVTGGASGLGRPTVEHFVNNGAKEAI